MSATDPISLLAEQVRRLDRDRYVTVLFAPSDRRAALFALYAFNIEVARIALVVREPLLGRIRLQWWRDTLQDLRAGRAVAHPVGKGLAAAIGALSPEPFDQLLSARERDLQTAPPDDLAALEAYALGTAGAINVLAMQSLGVEDGDALAAARSVGTAWALTGLLRSVPFHRRAGRVILPAALLAEQDLSPDDVLAGRPAPGLAKVAECLADRARGHLAAARRRAVPRAALAGLLTAPLAERYLAGLARSGFNLFDRRWSAPRPRPLRLAWAMLLGRF